MIDSRALDDCLADLDLEHWSQPLQSLVETRLCETNHGDFGKWRLILESLKTESLKNNGGDARELLLGLSPWRKGPFNIAGVAIDAEWRSDIKWARLKHKIAPLKGRNVLDVGCGNGFYSLQMRRAGARRVIGVDPTILFAMQFLAINIYEQQENIFVLPARLHELPLPARKFDTTFSMGVLYHQRSPVDHLSQLRETLQPGGQLVLETIYLPGDGAHASTPTDRYARMRNVWLLPTVTELTRWLNRTGFDDVRVIDQSVTSVDEQRTTDWMSFESLNEALDPNDAGRTIEGWPAPHRVILTARA